MSKELLLTKGKIAVVDDEDYEYLAQWNWYAMETHGIHYAVRTKSYGPRKDGKSKKILMHRTIMNCHNSMVIDHINGNGLDNRKINLRITTQSNNMRNSKKPDRNTSGFKGVNKYRNGKWRANIRLNNKQIHLGYFNTPEEAYEVYKEAAIKYFGEYACLER